MSEPTARAVPFYCPYCGEERLRPWEDEAEASSSESRRHSPTPWRCEDCSRVFVLRYKGMTGR